MNSEDLIATFLDKPHRCPECYRVDYNPITAFGLRLFVGACPGCEAKWYGIRFVKPWKGWLRVQRRPE